MKTTIQSFTDSLHDDALKAFDIYLTRTSARVSSRLDDITGEAALAVFTILAIENCDPFGNAIERFTKDEHVECRPDFSARDKLVWLFSTQTKKWNKFVRQVAKSICEPVDNDTPDFLFSIPGGWSDPQVDNDRISAFGRFLNSEFNVPPGFGIRLSPLSRLGRLWSFRGVLVPTDNEAVQQEQLPPILVAAFAFPNFEGGGSAHFVTHGIPFGGVFAERVMQAFVDCFWPGGKVHPFLDCNEHSRSKALLKESVVNADSGRYFNLTRLQDPLFKFPVVDGTDFHAAVVKLAISPGGKSWETIEFSSYTSWCSAATEAIDLFENAAGFTRASWYPVSVTIELDLGEAYGTKRHCEIELTRTRCNLDNIPAAAQEKVKEAIRRWGLISPALFTGSILADIMRFPNAKPSFGLSELGGADSVWLAKPKDGSTPIFIECGDAPGVLCPCGCGRHARVKDLIATCPTNGRQFRISPIELKQYELSTQGLADYIARAFHASGNAVLQEDGSFRLGPRRSGEKELFFIQRPTPDLLETKFKGKTDKSAVVTGCSNPPSFDNLPVVPMTDFFDDDFKPDSARIANFLHDESYIPQSHSIGNTDGRKGGTGARMEIIRQLVNTYATKRMERIRTKFGKIESIPVTAKDNPFDDKEDLFKPVAKAICLDPDPTRFRCSGASGYLKGIGEISRSEKMAAVDAFETSMQRDINRLNTNDISFHVRWKAVHETSDLQFAELMVMGESQAIHDSIDTAFVTDNPAHRTAPQTIDTRGGKRIERTPFEEERVRKDVARREQNEKARNRRAVKRRKA